MMSYAHSNDDHDDHRHESLFTYYTYQRSPTRAEIASIVCLGILILLAIWLCVSVCGRRSSDNDDDLDMEHPPTRFIILQRPHNPRTSDHFAQLEGPNHERRSTRPAGDLVYPPPYDSACPPEYGQPSCPPPYSRYVQPQNVQLQNVQPQTPSAPPLYSPSQ